MCLKEFYWGVVRLPSNEICPRHLSLCERRRWYLKICTSEDVQEVPMLKIIKRSISW